MTTPCAPSFPRPVLGAFTLAGLLSLATPAASRAAIPPSQVEEAAGAGAVYLDLIADDPYVSTTDPTLSLATDVFFGDWGWPDASDNEVSVDGDGDGTGDIFDDKDTFAPAFMATIAGLDPGETVDLFVLLVVKNASYDFSWGRSLDSMETIADIKSVGIPVVEDNGDGPDSYAYPIGSFTAAADGTIDLFLGEGVPNASGARTELDGIVVVPPPDPSAAIRSFAADPDAVGPGESAELRWMIRTDATAATIEPGGIDALAATDGEGLGSVTVTPAVDTTYTLTVDTPAETGATAETTVDVALIASFTADPSRIAAGESTTLMWHVRTDATVSIAPDPGAPLTTVDGVGSVVVAPSQTTGYVLTASAAGEDDATAQALVGVTTTTGGGAAYADPDGGWASAYEGDVDPLVDGWDDQNGSDEWDGFGVGSAGSSPGGAGILTEGDVTFLRIQDTGNPTAHGFPDPGSNRKIYFSKDLTLEFPPGHLPLTDGVTLYFRARVPIPDGLPLDDHHPDGGGAIEPWPASGDGYALHDGGKGSLGIRELASDSILSFALSTDLVGPGNDYTAGEGLTMSQLVGTTPSPDVDATDAGGIPNLLPLVPQDWHDVWITIEADTSGGGTHRAEIYLDGSVDPAVFHLTAGNGDDGQAFDYLAMGAGATPQSGAVDIDFFRAREGVHAPSPSAATAFRILEITFSQVVGEVILTWPSREGESFIIERTTDFTVWEELDDGFAAAAGADTTTFVDDSLGDDPPPGMFYRVRRN